MPDPDWMGDPDQLTEAWGMCNDAEAMVTLLRVGGNIGAFQVDEVTEFGSPTTRWLFRMQVRGKFYRIDVERDGGGDAVRKCLPDFPGAAEWSVLIAENRSAMAPLARLRGDLAAGRAPKIDAEVQRAWVECDEPFLMMQILDGLGRADEVRREIRWPADARGRGIEAHRAWKRELVVELRRVAPRVVT